jgi:ketosteroid isomerase-like protein
MKGETSMTSSNVAGSGQALWREQIGRVQDMARRAFLAQDVEGMSPLLSDDFMVNSPIGRVLSKGEMLGLLRRGIIRHYSYEEQIELMARQGDLVVVMGHDVVTNTPGATPVRRRFTNVWRKAAGSWRMVVRHAHHLPEA